VVERTSICVCQVLSEPLTRSVTVAVTILFLYVVIYKIIISVFKDFKLNIVVNISYRRKINSLTPLLLSFVDLLTYICHII
jgi:hypothetical protein